MVGVLGSPRLDWFHLPVVHVDWERDVEHVIAGHDEPKDTINIPSLLLNWNVPCVLLHKLVAHNRTGLGREEMVRGLLRMSPNNYM